MSSLKDIKEAFVTGHTGTTASEILLVCSSSPIGILLFHEIRNFITKRKTEQQQRQQLPVRLPLSFLIVIESVTILFPMTLCQTECLYPYGVILLFLELVLGLSLYTYRRYIKKTSSGIAANGNNKKKDKDTDKPILSSTSPSTLKSKPELEFLTFYRSTVSYLTFVAILAVDFTIFPRSFAKTEVYGYGLMDLGAASFCVSGGFVSWFARDQSQSKSGTQKDVAKAKSKSNHKMKKVLFNSIPLVIMALIRLVTTKGLEYQEHVSEYGVHWNFFFTLTIVGIASTFIRSYLNIKVPVLPWAFLLICYQLILSFGNGQHYIVDHPRVCSESNEDNNNFLGNFFFLCDFFAANREGLLGSIGYLIIHLACEDIGKYCIWSCSRNNDNDHHHDHQYEKKNQGRSTQEKRLFLTTIIFWFLHWVSSSSTMFNIPVSRRSTNATFIFWAIAHNMTILSLVWLSFFYCSKRSIHSLKSDNDDDESTITPPIFAAVNKHGLIVFILANLMTGAVNLSMNTLEATNSQAIAVIFCYLCAVGTVALFVDYIFRHGTRKQKKD